MAAKPGGGITETPAQQSITAGHQSGTTSSKNSEKAYIASNHLTFKAKYVDSTTKHKDFEVWRKPQVSLDGYVKSNVMAARSMLPRKRSLSCT